VAVPSAWSADQLAAERGKKAARVLMKKKLAGTQKKKTLLDLRSRFEVRAKKTFEFLRF